MGRTRRADLWSKELLLPRAASLVLITAEPRGLGQSWRQKVIPEPEDVPAGFTVITVMGVGETGFELPRPENELIKQGVLFHLSITSSKITICHLRHLQPSNAQLREGPGGRSHSSSSISNPSSLFHLWHNGSSHCKPQNQKCGRLARKWENLIIGWICVLKASSLLAETSASSQKSIFDFLVLMLRQPNKSL